MSLRSLALVLVSSGCYQGVSPAADGSEGDTTTCSVDCGASTTTTAVAAASTDDGSTGAAPAASSGSSTGADSPASSGGDASSGGGAIVADPCPPDEPCRIMPLGDSITEGDLNGAYRARLFRMALADGKSLTFVGNQSGGPDDIDGTPFPRDHEGHSGFYIDRDHGGDLNISELVDATIAEHQPHIILLMIGANDVARAHLPDSAAHLEVLVDRILADAPDALLVLAQITPAQSDTDNPDVEAYNAAMPAIVDARAAAGANIALVDMYAAITAVPDWASTLYVDNLHPNVDGDEVVAATWYAAIGPLLP